MQAIISDVHANLEALHAVLDQVGYLRRQDIYCLGDVVGYGPNPIECVDLAAQLPVVLLGNHDQAALFDPDGFGPVAERSTFWTREQLEALPADDPDRQRRLRFLHNLPRTHLEGDVLLVHGSPRNPLHEYVFPEDIYNIRKMGRLGALFTRVCFAGHTHLPGVFVENAPEQWEFLSPDDCPSGFRLDHRKVLCNVGSVGQPRDHDWRACYVLFDGATIHFRRVEYDVEATMRKIRAVLELDDFLADRLRDGR
jgi:diadenosine tetraphosphatase ApaH/serine/threonine PP2A family protein phosphatase